MVAVNAVSTFSSHRLSEAKRRYSRVYGPHHQTLHHMRSSHMLGQTYTLPDGTEIDAAGYISMALGFVSGIEYDSSEISNCYYSTFELVSQFSHFTYDLNNLKIYNLIVYDPIHTLGNVIATLEYCDWNAVLQSFSPYFGLDYANMADQLTRIVVASFTSFSVIFTRFT